MWAKVHRNVAVWSQIDAGGGTCARVFKTSVATVNTYNSGVNHEL